MNKIATLLLVVFAIACVDESKDPVKFTEVKKATYLAIRAESQDALNNTGCSNSFFKNNIIGTEVYTIVADFLSEDQDVLEEVQIFAQTPDIARVQVGTVSGSVFAFPSGATTKRGTVSVPLATILTKLNISTGAAASLKAQDITISTDLVLKDGSKVLASSIVNANLFQSVIFYPAMVLTYCANDVADFLPIATSKVISNVPLKSAAKDTLYFSYDKPEIINIPTVTISPANHGGTLSAVARYKNEKNGFYAIYTAGAGFTGAVTATISGAKANVAGVELTQLSKEQTINVDNTAPQLISSSTGDRIGKGQFVTIKATYNEKLSKKSADAIKITLTGQGLEAVTNAAMEVSADGLTASYIYIFKLASPSTPATHGDLTISFAGGKDEAGNAAPLPSGTLLVDVGTPPAPTLTPFGGGYDLGTQIKWEVTQTSGGSNPGGSTTGKVFFVAVEAGSAAPTGVSFDNDGNAIFTMATDVDALQTGMVAVEDGSSGIVFTPFTAKGTLDVYAVFASSSNTVSALTAAPQATITMN